MSNVSKVLPIEEHSRKSFQIKEDFNAKMLTPKSAHEESTPTMLCDFPIIER